ncbi:MAG: alpha/beta hydrolase family protein [Aeoliella sp.]
MDLPAHQATFFISCVAVGLFVVGRSYSAEPSEPQPATSSKDTVRLTTTKNGIQFGTWGKAPATPAPTLLVFAGTIELTLGPDHDGYYRQCATFLAPKGYLCVSLDLPCHGREKIAQEAEGLSGWRERVEAGQPLIDSFQTKVAAVLDHLIASGDADPDRIATCGVSRGGFVALHLAAREPRIAATAAFAPVTDLAVLTEFAGAEQLPAVKALALKEWADRHAGRPIRLVIGDQDRRVGTDHAIAFSRRVARRAREAQLPGALELHVVPEPRGHAIPVGTFKQAADWIEQQLHLQAAP